MHVRYVHEIGICTIHTSLLNSTYIVVQYLLVCALGTVCTMGTNHTFTRLFYVFFAQPVKLHLYHFWYYIILSYYVLGLVCQVPYHERIHKKYDNTRPCIYRIYLSILHSKRLSKKNESDHGGAARCASSGMAFVIETISLPPHVCDGLIEGPVEGLYIIIH
jgi:hypothetical protein